MKRWLLILLLLLLPVARAADDHRDTPEHRSLESMGYQVLRDGSIPPEEGVSGTFGMYQHAGGWMLLMLDYKPVPNAPTSPLQSNDLAYVTQHLLGDYVGLNEHKTYVLREHPVRTLRGYAAVTRLRVRFSDKFVEPDTIARFDYPDNRHVILLLGKPSDGAYENCPAFRDQFTMLDRALADIVNNTAIGQGILVKKRPRPANMLPVMHPGSEPDCCPGDF